MLIKNLARRLWWVLALVIVAALLYIGYMRMGISISEPAEAPAEEEAVAEAPPGSIYREAPYVFPDEMPLREDIMRPLFGFCEYTFGEDFIDDEDFKTSAYIQYGDRLFFQVHGRSLMSKRVEIWVLEFKYDGEAWDLAGAAMNTTMELFMQHYDSFTASMEGETE